MQNACGTLQMWMANNSKLQTLTIFERTLVDFFHIIAEQIEDRRCRLYVQQQEIYSGNDIIFQTRLTYFYYLFICVIHKVCSSVFLFL